jgi:Fic family protein
MMATDRHPFLRDEPYNTLPPLPPAVEVETKAVLKAAIEAHRALADLRGAARLIPNQGILVRSIALQEARMSSEIEHIVTTNDELYRAWSQDEANTDVRTKEVLRYGDASWRGYGRIKKGLAIDTEMFQALASEILRQEAGIREGAGTRVGNPVTGEVIYTPPIGRARIQAMLDNLSVYLADPAGPDSLVRLAVTHYQFEAIHPFRDGNGRVGRVVNVLFLVQQGLLDLPILYLSRAILDDKTAYYNGIRQVTERGAWEEWILYVLDLLSVTAVETRRRIEVIRAELEEAVGQARAQMVRGYSRELLELVFEQPYTRIAFLERRGIAKRQTASEYLQELERIGLLRGVKQGREMYYINDRLLQALSA